MVSISKLLSVATLASVSAGWSLVMQWTVKDAPKSGVDKLSFSYKVHKYMKGGYYMASQMGFVNREQVAVTGIQPHDDGGAQAMFSVFGKEATVIDSASCHGDANGGPGVTCRVPMREFKLGKRYYFVVERDSSNPRIWRGTVTDLGSYRQQIGAWKLAPEVGGLDARNGQAAYLDYMEPIHLCRVPYLDTTWYAPRVADPIVDHSREITLSHMNGGSCNDFIKMSQTQLPNKEATRIRVGF